MRMVGASPPVLVTLPLKEALVASIEEAATVVTAGAVACVEGQDDLIGIARVFRREQGPDLVGTGVGVGHVSIVIRIANHDHHRVLTGSGRGAR